MSVLENWDQWKGFLGGRLRQAEDKGMNSNAITEVATEIGGYLADKVEPKNAEERVLKDLWSVASEEERHSIASTMVKLVQNNKSE
ncbi:DUF3243 domain-containing protein [Alkalihalobacillus sp. AL-G]|uniref:DUF3243 domain-containing protein n=1 Tax=Alkalihalobacillus sp. AL-G TaxID=2926399 RepID=UPI00272CB6F8|nr:DUF3243 domain-containing protein [Alkalihalobacillus sp. AL-G]WLD95218.1 DUF3243 domain-containing protein [Alkalihalobacillus sp. AL-G]